MWEQLKALMDAEVAAGRCHGYAVVAAQGARTLFSATGGTLGGEGTPAVTPKTRFDLDGLTEAMVAAPLTLLALENGLLSLSDPVSRFFAVPGGKKSITLWHLLTHTSGMEPSFLLEPEAVSPEDSLRAIFARSLGAEIGKRAKHSGVGYIALGKAIEQVYAMPIDKAAKKLIFDPLGMKCTGFLPTGADIAHSGADEATGQPRVGEPHDENARFLHGVTAGAGLFADIADCGRFTAMLAAGGRMAEGILLTRDSLRLATQEHTPGMKEAYGLGFVLTGREGSFMGDLWPSGGFGQTGYTGVSLAVEPESGLSLTLLQSRAHVEKGSPELLRLRRLIHNAAFAAARRTEG